jgi:hypothetical protein
MKDETKQKMKEKMKEKSTVDKTNMKNMKNMKQLIVNQKKEFVQKIQKIQNDQQKKEKQKKLFVIQQKRIFDNENEQKIITMKRMKKTMDEKFSNLSNEHNLLVNGLKKTIMDYENKKVVDEKQIQILKMKNDQMISSMKLFLGLVILFVAVLGGFFWVVHE